MYVKFHFRETGFRVPRYDYGVSVATRCLISLKDTPNSPAFVLRLESGFELGDKKGSLVVTDLETEWVGLDLKRHPWMCNQRVLIGKACKISLTGTVVRGGHVDITMTMFDKHHEEAYSFSKVYIKAGGIQLADAELKGILKSHEANMSLADRLQCAK